MVSAVEGTIIVGEACGNSLPAEYIYIYRPESLFRISKYVCMYDTIAVEIWGRNLGDY